MERTSSPKPKIENEYLKEKLQPAAGIGHSSADQYTRFFNFAPIN
jgi:hypothetical protein